MADIQIIKKWLQFGSINIFGMPFAGKDTQGNKLAEMLGGELVGGGDILRHYHDQDELQKLLATGELIPSDMYLKIVLPFLSQERLKQVPLILSSVGRKKGEEEVILHATEHSGHPLRAVVMLNLDEDEVWRRFEAAKTLNDRGSRGDDSPETLKVRLAEFAEDTKPVIEFYRQKGLLLEIDGSQSREHVTESIFSQLQSLA